jgi:hypothetical protein
VRVWRSRAGRWERRRDWKSAMRLTGERARVEVVRVEDVVERVGEEASERLSEGRRGGAGMAYNRSRWGVVISDRGLGVLS